MEEAIGLFGFMVVYYLVILAVSITMYVLFSLGLYTIANRRGINNAWLAWIPLGSVWILGCIADDYQLKACNAVKSRRKVMLVLSIVTIVLVFVVYGSFFAVMFEAITEGDSLDVEDLVGSLATMGFASLILAGVSIALTVIQYICLYDLYASCDPNNKTLFLLLSIFVSGLMSILIFVCRNKDDGMRPAPRPVPYGYMPPQYQQPPYGQPPYQQPYQPQQPVYQQPYQQPVYQQPYQPQQPQQPTYQQPQQPADQDQGAQQ